MTRPAFFVTRPEPDPPTPIRRRITIGTATGCTVCLNDAAVSPCHAMVTMDVQGHVWVVDLGSKTGTFVYRVGEQDRITVGTQPFEVFPSDAILIGKTIIPWKVDQ